MKGISKTFGDVKAVDNVSLEIESGSFTTFLGPSGCGKTTLLRIITGLEEPDRGQLYHGDRVFVDTDRGFILPARERSMGLVFQSYALWPHMTVYENVAYGLRVKKVSNDKIKKRVLDILDKVQMKDLEERYPNELSGGQQQRVALARMLIIDPKVLLLDEPLSNLDAKLRMKMRAELKRLHSSTNMNIIYVTHDQIEAMSLSTHIAVMKDGKIQQYDSPQNVYSRSANLFVADFMGNPSVNLLEGEIEKNKDRCTVRILGKYDLALSDNLSSRLKERQKKKVIMAVSPENIRVAKDKTRNGIPARVYALFDFGSDIYINMNFFEKNFQKTLIIARVDKDFPSVKLDETVYIEFSSRSFNLYDQESELLL